MKFALAFTLWHASFGGAPRREVLPDRWIAVDKFEHVAASAIIQSWTHMTFRARGASYAQASWGAAAVTAAAGIGKELWDRTHHGDFSYRDLAADGLGLGVGAVMMRQVDR
jgi:uncharacterized protein YfiM (DUF2279 family)